MRIFSVVKFKKISYNFYYLFIVFIKLKKLKTSNAKLISHNKIDNAYS